MVIETQVKSKTEAHLWLIIKSLSLADDGDASMTTERLRNSGLELLREDHSCRSMEYVMLSG